MKIAVVTGSGGLVGSAVVRQLAPRFDHIIGIDNGMRAVFFGVDASTVPTIQQVSKQVRNYIHWKADIRDVPSIERVFLTYKDDIKLVVHCAGQPSHDWGGLHPIDDFDHNAGGTLNILEATRTFCKDALFVFMSTNKVYGDSVNYLPLEANFTRWDLPDYHIYHNGIDETFDIDASTHSPFGVSKLAADLMVQEYGNYYDMNVACLRAGCMTGAAHQGTQLHGFLSYLMKCIVTGAPYTVYGYGAKQVRDNIDARDVATIVEALYDADGGDYAVYNIGGERENSISVQEAIWRIEGIADRKINWHYDEQARKGDHKWWITNMTRFHEDFPNWKRQYDLDTILLDMYKANADLWRLEAAQ